MQSTLIVVGFLVVFGVAYTQQCADREFECDNGNCIRGTWFCDGDNDCGDWSDEPENCLPPCPAGFWKCPTGSCIPESYVCDGDNDCGDMSDEPEDCPPCPFTFWECPNGECVYEAYICDGSNDCGDWGDEREELCPCADNEIRCPTVTPPGEGPPGGCIPPEYICDSEGIWDCTDGSDEANCTTQSASKLKVNKIHVVTLKTKHSVQKKASKSKKAFTT